MVGLDGDHACTQGHGHVCLQSLGRTALDGTAKRKTQWGKTRRSSRATSSARRCETFALEIWNGKRGQSGAAGSAHGQKKNGGGIDLVNQLPSEAFQLLGDRVGAVRSSLGLGLSFSLHSIFPCVYMGFKKSEMGAGLYTFMVEISGK